MSRLSLLVKITDCRDSLKVINMYRISGALRNQFRKPLTQEYQELGEIPNYKKKKYGYSKLMLLMLH